MEAEVINQLISGELSGSEAQRLIAELEGSPEALEELGRHLVIDSLLSIQLEEKKTASERVSLFLRQITQIEREQFVEKVVSRIRFQCWVKFTPAIIVVAASLAIVCIIFSRNQRVVAEIVSITSSQKTSIQEGQVFGKGDSIKFDSGLVELHLPGRGDIVIEGPAELDFIDNMNARLRQGRLHMRVENGGRGYRVKTLGGDIVDLGTEFGVSVNRFTGEVQAHVLEGEVLAEIGEYEPLLLDKDEALRFGNSEPKRMVSDEGAFYSSLPPSATRELKVVHWSMDSSKDGRYKGESKGFDCSDYELSLVAKESSSLPRVVEGPFGNALSFTGRRGFAKTRFPGITGGKPRTVAFWLKVPSNLKSKSQSYGAVSWGGFDKQKGGVWQISVNPVEEDGPVGRLRLGVFDAETVGTTDLRDDQWHHVAVVLYKARHPDVGKHVILYLDGQVEPISKRSFGVIETKVGDKGNGVWLGRNITSQEVSYPNWGYFRGAIDELFIFEGALGQGEVQRLMKENRW